MLWCIVLITDDVEGRERRKKIHARFGKLCNVLFELLRHYSDPRYA